MKYDQKFVDYKKWCPKCEHKEESSIEDPCNNCLDEPTNENTTKPLYFKEAKETDRS